MSLTMCSHPMMIESAARYGSASSNIRVTPTRLISASALAAISRRNTNTSVIYQTFRNESRMISSPAQNRTCSLPEIPISPSQRSVASSDSPLLVQTRRIAEKQCEATSDGSCPYQLSRNSTFPNFRALQTIAVTTKTRTLGLTKNSKMKISATMCTLSNDRVPLPVTPILSSENDQIRNCEKDLRRNRSIEDVLTPTGFSTLASLPGNRYGDTEGQRYARSDEMIHAYVADRPVSSKLRKKKSTKKKKRQSRAKSRSQSSHNHPHDAKQSSKTPKDNRGPLQDNSLSSLLFAVPVLVEPKKIEIYSSRYTKCDSENAQSKRNPSEEKGNHVKLKKVSSETIATNHLGTMERDPVIYSSRVSPRIPGGGGVPASRRGREDGYRVTKVFMSETQSGNLRECGCILPCAPPGTPTPEMLQKYQYIPSMTDLRSQRTVRDRLSGMEEKAKKKVQQQKEEARKTEQQLQRDQSVALKQRQRLEIYALNKIMTEFEWKNFEEFMKKVDGKTS